MFHTLFENYVTTEVQGVEPYRKLRNTEYICFIENN